jgi:hypothetical protein
MNVPKQLFIENLNSEQVAAIQRRMKSGKFSKDSFLRWYQSLKRVIEADRGTLQKIRITYDQIADKLDYLFHESYHRPADLIDGIFNVTTVLSAGGQECPFFYETELTGSNVLPRVYTCGLGSRSLFIKNERQGTEIIVSDLLLHLIRDHHFFEGGSSRLNPIQVIRTLELEPEVDYFSRRL